MVARRLHHKALIVILTGLLLMLHTGVVLAQTPAGRPAVHQINGPTASVNTWKLNVRAGPGTGYQILGTVSYREVLGLLGRTYDNSWLQIHRDDDMHGWVSAHYMMVSNAHLSAVPIVDASDPTPAPSEFSGTVTAYRLNVREGPGVTYPVAAVLREGQTVTFVGRDPNTAWLQMTLWDGTKGWVSVHFIRGNFRFEALPITGGAVPNPLPGTLAAVTAYKLNVRSGPSLAYGIKAWVYRGQQVHLLGRNHTQTWLKISMDNGLGGWVSAAYITTDYPIASLPVAE